MPKSLKVSKTAVRRFLLETQALLPGAQKKIVRTSDVLEMVQHLECVQLDPVAAVARNQHLVLGARMPKYKPETLEQLLGERRVFEYWANAACVIPMADYPMFELIRRRLTERLAPRLERLGSVVDAVLNRLAKEGPLPSKAFESAQRVHGYWDNGEQPKTKATSHALNLLNDMGRIHVVHREGTTRYFDISERAIPKHLLEQAEAMSDAEAEVALIDKYLRAYRVFDVGDPRFGWQHLTVGERREAVNRRVEQGTVVPLEIEGVKRSYFVLAEDVDRLMQHAADSAKESVPLNHVRFLPPLDNLLWRRERVKDLFDFSYTWEVYIPAAKRQFGYYAMPILMGDILIGRVDPRLDRENARLNIQLLQIEPHIRWTKTLRKRVLHALEDFARFHQAELGNIDRMEPEGRVTL